MGIARTAGGRCVECRSLEDADLTAVARLERLQPVLGDFIGGTEVNLSVAQRLCKTL